MAGMFKEMLALPLQAARPSKGRCRTPRGSNKIFWHQVARYFVSLWQDMFYQSWMSRKSMTGFMTGIANSWLVGWSWLINHGGVGVRTQMTFKSCLFWCWWNPEFFFQRGVAKSSWFCSSHTTLTNTAKKKSEAQIRTRLTQTCAILASDFCWYVLYGKFFFFQNFLVL